MNKYTPLVIFGLLVVVGAAAATYYFKQPDAEVQNSEVVEVSETATPLVLTTELQEDAEITGFQFMRDVVAVAPPATDEAAKIRLYDALSESAKREVDMDTISRDAAAFVGIQDVPDLGVTVEDLQFPEDGRAQLIVGLNYSGSGFQKKSIEMVREEGAWKVDSVSNVLSED